MVAMEEPDTHGSDLAEQRKMSADSEKQPDQNLTISKPSTFTAKNQPTKVQANWQETGTTKKDEKSTQETPVWSESKTKVCQHSQIYIYIYIYTDVYSRPVKTESDCLWLALRVVGKRYDA